MDCSEKPQSVYDKREIYRHVPLLYRLTRRLQTDCYDTLLHVITWKYVDELSKSVRTCEKILATPLFWITFLRE